MRNLEGYSQQPEKLISLGTMAAGLAHELNNPAAAAWHASTHLQQSVTQAQRYFKQPVVALGIETPRLREFVAGQVMTLKPGWSAEQAIDLCERLLGEPELETRGAGILLLGAFRDQLTPDFLSRAKLWLEQRLDNWALVDSFCSSILSPLLERHWVEEIILELWSDDSSLWVRRAVMVTFVPFARRGERLEAAYEVAREHLCDPEDLMHKAVGWLLRECGKTDMKRLQQFLLLYGPAIPRTTMRYAIERFPAAQRARLLRATQRKSNRSPRGTVEGTLKR